MADQKKTPGVYIVELDAFPNTIVEVETAIPVFIGYTEKAANGNVSLHNKPTRITGMDDYMNYFGGASKTIYSMTATSAAGISFTAEKGKFMLFDSMRLFYSNGGGPCYIVSVGKYSDTIEKGNKDLATGLLGALLPLKREQEPTLVVVPDAVQLSEQDCYDVYNEVLMHCQEMQSRFAIMDIHNGFKPRTSPEGDVVETFRNKVQQALNYGASYYPWVNTSVVADSELDYSNINEDGLKILMSRLKREASRIFDATNPAQQTKKRAFERLVEKLEPLPTVSSTTDTLVATAAAELAALQVRKSFQDKFLSATTSFGQVLVEWRETIAEAAQGVTLAGLPEAAAIQEASGNPDPVAAETALNVIYTPSGPNELPDGSLFDASQNAIQALASAVNDAEAELQTRVKAIDPTKPETQAAVDEQNKIVDNANEALDSAKMKIFQGKENADKSFALFSAAKLALNNAELGLKKFFGEGDEDGLVKQRFDAVDKAVTDALAQTAQPKHNVTATHLSLMAVSPEYKMVMKELRKTMNLMPPSSAMAGVYTRIDNNSGVFQAPANTGLVSVVSPTIDIDHDEQEDLNVPLNGKAVNAIRSFPGRGVLVWGARTLDGNSQDWRYINVRRTLIMLEQSIKVAMFAYVFEPNTSNTWSTVNSMISNFLTNQWKAGALAGATPAEAFEVHVGLGSTMTSNDILDGYMRVTVKVAITRPAEFIVLTFQQKVQTS